MPAAEHEPDNADRRTPPRRDKPAPRRRILLYLSEYGPGADFDSAVRVSWVGEVPGVVLEESRTDEHSIFARVATQHFMACARYHQTQVVLEGKFHTGLDLGGVGRPSDESWLQGGVGVVFHVG